MPKSKFIMHSAAFFVKEYGKLIKARIIIDPKKLKPDSVIIRQTYIGLNQYDANYLHGRYKKKLPLVIGSEAVGIIEYVGSNVTNFKPGDRVGYCTANSGGYCTHRSISSKIIYKIPNEISDEHAAAVMLKGITACTMIKKAFFACPGSFIMVYNITGGVGYIIAQWLKATQSIVIGTVSNKKRISLAKKYKFQDVLLNHSEDFVSEIMNLTKHIGVVAIIDPIGQSLYQQSLEALSFYGSLISYGSMSGALSSIKYSDLVRKSLYVVCPYFKHYHHSQNTLHTSIEELFTLVKNKKIIPVINKIYSFNEIPQAHEDMAKRQLVHSNIIKI